jgi:hypothetical protein
MTTTIEIIMDRIDEVLSQNKRIEWIYIILTVLLFLLGIACMVSAIVTGQYLWTTPSAITTSMLYFPLKEIKDIRQKNIALATAPILITQLPTDKAAEEIQKLLQSLYGGK